MLSSSQSSLSRSMDRPKLWSSLEPGYSLDNVPEFDPNADIDSPRSLLACEMEGVLVEELVYTPMKEFFLPGLDPQVIQMRHDFHEARRQDLLAVVRHRRMENLRSAGESPSLSSSALRGKGMKSPKSQSILRPKTSGLIPPGEENPFEAYVTPGAPPFIAPFVHTYAFFQKWNDALAPSKEMPKDPNATSSQSLASPTGSLDLASSSSPPLYAGRLIQTPSMFRDDPDEENFLRQLNHMRTCDGNSRVERDFAKNTENHLVVLRNDEERARGSQQSNAKTIVKNVNKMQVHTFQRLMNDWLENREKREHRETFMRPSHLPRNAQHDARNQLAFLNAVDIMSKVVKRQTDHLHKGTEVDHARTEKLAKQRVIKKMSVAQSSMAERLRWRENHHEKVTLAGERLEAEKMRMFLQREEDLKRRRAVADDRGKLRMELQRCRQINRDCNEELRTRKGAYLKSKGQQLKAEKFIYSPQSSMTLSRSLPALSPSSSPVGQADVQRRPFS